jgi:hypothetical protein
MRHLAREEKAPVSENKTIKQRVEENIPMVLLGASVASFVAGFGTYAGILKAIVATSYTAGQIADIKRDVAKSAITEYV